MGEQQVSAAGLAPEAADRPGTDGCELDDSRAPVAFGRRAVPQLFDQLKQPGAARRRRALTSLCDLLHHQDLIYQAVTGGYLERMKALFRDKDPSVRTKTCELLHIVTAHSFGRQALLASALLPPLSKLLDDSSISCRRNVHRVLNHLSLLPAGSRALLSLVPKLMLKLQEEKEEEEEVQVLLLSTLSCCSRLDPVPALACDGIPLLRHKLTHPSPSVRREAAAAMMALSVCEDGKWKVCEGAVLPVLLKLLQDKDVEVQANAAGVVMYTVIITRGKQLCLELGFIPVLLQLLARKSEEEEERRRRRKALTLYTLRALTSLGEAPLGRHVLLYQLAVMRERSGELEDDQDVRQAAQTAIRVITRVP